MLTFQCYGSRPRRHGCYWPGSRFRNHRLEPPPREQRHSDHPGNPDPRFPKKVSGVPEDTEWLVRFGDKHWTDHLKKAAQDWKFHSTLKPRLDIEVEDWHAAQPDDTPEWTVINEPGEDTTGLGPPMRATYRWPSEDDRD